MHPRELSVAAQVQERLWGADPEGWATFAEPHNRPLFEAVLDAARVRAGTRLLDVGCGTGMALVLAQARGAVVSGIDVSSGLLGVTRARLIGADIRHAEMEALPYPDGGFDAVVGVNSFQFAGDARSAFAEAARVCRPGGTVVASLFAEPERSEATVLHTAMSALSPPERQADHAPYLLSAPGNLEAAMTAAGLVPGATGEVVCVWRYDDVAGVVRGLTSSAGAARALADSSPEAVERAIREAVEPYVDPSTGAVAMTNTFRWTSATRTP